MSLITAPRRVEAALGVSYPASFHAGANDLAALAATTSFERAFPATRLLFDVEEIRRAREHVGGRLIPFMESAGEHPDVYARSMEVVRMVEQGDTVMAELTGVARRAAGGEMRMSIAEVFVMRDGKIAERRVWVIVLNEDNYR